MKTILLFVLTFAASVRAQETAPVSEPESSPERSVAEMEQILARQEQLVEKLSKEFFDLNDQIESRIQSVVQALAAMEDSPESKTRISRMKKEIIEDLKQSIQMLQRQRGADAAMLSQTPHAMQENASNAKAREILGEKVKARVDQIMVLAGSLHGNQDVQKYEYYLKEGYGSDDLKVKKRKSDEYKQNKKQNSRASMTREELIQDIEKEEFRLTQKVNHIKAENQRAGGGALPPQLAADLDQTLSFLEILKEKKQEILKGKNIETEPVGDAREAMMLEKQLQGAVSQLRTANNLLRQKGQVLRVEWDRLQAQKRLLEQKSAP